MPFANPTIATPVTFRQSATDADNHLRDQASPRPTCRIRSSSRATCRLVGGLRFDRFDLQYHNNRNGDTLDASTTWSRRAPGIVFKPIAPLSIYGSYSVSYLPSSGDQFSSLTTITQQVKPEKFNNYEVGAQVGRAAEPVADDGGLSAGPHQHAVDRSERSHAHRADRQPAHQRLRAWASTAASRRPGRSPAATPIRTRSSPAPRRPPRPARRSARCRTTRSRCGTTTSSIRDSAAGLGLIYRSDMFAAIDNTVTLPGYTRADAAVFFSLTKRVRLQANVENLFDTRYYVNADSNTNISPGFPRTLRIGLTTVF